MATSDLILKVGVRLSIHPFSCFTLYTYGLALTYPNPNFWSQIIRSQMLWHETTLGEDLSPSSIPYAFQKLQRKVRTSGVSITSLRGVLIAPQYSPCRLPSKDGKSYSSRRRGIRTPCKDNPQHLVQFRPSIPLLVSSYIRNVLCHFIF